MNRTGSFDGIGCFVVIALAFFGSQLLLHYCGGH
jgi:hypothetical protein